MYAKGLWAIIWMICPFITSYAVSASPCHQSVARVVGPFLESPACNAPKIRLKMFRDYIWDFPCLGPMSGLPDKGDSTCQSRQVEWFSNIFGVTWQVEEESTTSLKTSLWASKPTYQAITLKIDCRHLPTMDHRRSDQKESMERSPISPTNCKVANTAFVEDNDLRQFCHTCQDTSA